MRELRRFTRDDWYAYAGATQFPDGTDPYITEYGPLTIIVDGLGLQAFLEDEEVDALIVMSEDIEYLIDIARGLMRSFIGLTPSQMKYLLNAMK